MARTMSKLADEHFAKTGLSSSYALVLMTVADKAGISPGEIAEQLQLDPSTVTRFLDKMQMRELIKRESCGRASNVFITAKGEQLIPEIKAAWKGLYEDYSAKIGLDDTKALTLCMNQAMEKL